MNSSLIDSYKRAQRRLLLLDYDGTLRDFELKPELAQPTDEIYGLLRGLAADTKNTVVVVSGRHYKNLEDWFGGLSVHCIAEHGLAYRAPGQKWQIAPGPSTAWQAPVRKLMENAVSSAPGSFVRTKTDALVWHYRVADKDAAAAALRILQEELSPVMAKHKLRALAGSKVLEVHPIGIDKGSAARKWFDLAAYDFVLVIGDDVTDEDLFRVLLPGAFSIKVGNGETAATERLPDPAAVRALLAKLVSAE